MVNPVLLFLIFISSSLVKFVQPSANLSKCRLMEGRIVSFHFTVQGTFVTELCISNQDITFFAGSCTVVMIFPCSKLSAPFIACLTGTAGGPVWSGLHDAKKANRRNLHSRRPRGLSFFFLLLKAANQFRKKNKKKIIFGRCYFCRKFLVITYFFFLVVTKPKSVIMW